MERQPEELYHLQTNTMVAGSASLTGNGHIQPFKVLTPDLGIWMIGSTILSIRLALIIESHHYYHADN